MSRGRLITLEGSEGVGKSTNLDVVCEFLEEKRIRFTVTREPGGTEIAERIRELLLSETTEIMDGLTELLLMFAARHQHLTRKILPELDQGLWVVSDRFTDASYAYQAFGRSIEIEKVDTLRRLVQDGFNPDLTLLLDVSGCLFCGIPWRGQPRPGRLGRAGWAGPGRLGRARPVGPGRQGLYAVRASEEVGLSM